jgi:hypothetical protein
MAIFNSFLYDYQWLHPWSPPAFSFVGGTGALTSLHGLTQGMRFGLGDAFGDSNLGICFFMGLM